MSQRTYLRDPHKEAYWRRMIRRQQQSSLNVRQFCGKEKISENSFSAWRRVLKQRDAEGQSCAPPQRLAAITNSGNSSDCSSAAEPLFAPVSVIAHNAFDQSNTLEVLLPNGVVLRVPAGFDGVTLAGVLSALHEAFPERPAAVEASRAP